MATTLVKNADRMMASAATLDEGIELTFVDGCSGLIPFGDLPEVAAGGGFRDLELPTPYEMVLITVSGERSEIPWDFARHYCDPTYRPRIEAQARRGESGWPYSGSSRGGGFDTGTAIIPRGDRQGYPHPHRKGRTQPANRNPRRNRAGPGSRG